METSVESLCNLLVRSRLLPPSGIRTMHQRWKTEAKERASDANMFVKWLVVNKFLTEYQANLLLRGKVDNFFLGDYKLLDRLGQGRMAGIYEALHSTGQRVAIKVLPPSKVKDPESFGRFQREARLAVKLKHPNVVRTFQMQVANNLNFIVMEYLDGDTLEEVLQRRKQLPPNEAARVIHQALLGLQHIHEQGMVHRDLKPANLMLVPAVKKGQIDSTMHTTVKVLDIGLGRALFDEGAVTGPAGNDLTGTGAMLGTPEYLAPEQARNAHTADIRADIYSLGCVLYHCLAGRPPFQEANPVLQMVKHATEPPRPLREFNPAVPDGLQQIINWMLSKDPAQRYPTPDRAAQALQVFLQAGQERPPELDAQMQAYLKWLEANPGEAAAAGLPSVTPSGGIPSLPGAAVAVATAPVSALPTLVPQMVMAEPQVIGDVELVAMAPPQPQPVAQPAAQGSSAMLLLILGLGLGIGVVLLLGVGGWLIYTLLMKR